MSEHELQKAKEDDSDTATSQGAIEKAYPASSIEPLLEKMVAGLESLKAENASLKKQMSRLLRKEPQAGGKPEDDVESEGDIDHDPTTEEEDNEPSPEGDTKSAKNTAAGTSGAFVKSADAIEQRIMKQVEERLQKVSTPIPLGYPDTPITRDLLGAGGIKMVVAKAITADRINCGKGDLAAGMFKAGTGDDVARGATLQWMKKNLEGVKLESNQFLYKTWEGDY